MDSTDFIKMLSTLETDFRVEFLESAVDHLFGLCEDLDGRGAALRALSDLREKCALKFLKKKSGEL